MTSYCSEITGTLTGILVGVEIEIPSEKYQHPIEIAKKLSEDPNSPLGSYLLQSQYGNSRCPVDGYRDGNNGEIRTRTMTPEELPDFIEKLNKCNDFLKSNHFTEDLDYQLSISCLYKGKPLNELDETDFAIVSGAIANSFGEHTVIPPATGVSGSYLERFVFYHPNDPRIENKYCNKVKGLLEDKLESFLEELKRNIAENEQNSDDLTIINTPYYSLGLNHMELADVQDKDKSLYLMFNKYVLQRRSWTKEGEEYRVLNVADLWSHFIIEFESKENFISELKAKEKRSVLFKFTRDLRVCKKDGEYSIYRITGSNAQQFNDREQDALQVLDELLQRVSIKGIYYAPYLKLRDHAMKREQDERDSLINRIISKDMYYSIDKYVTKENLNQDQRDNGFIGNGYIGIGVFAENIPLPKLSHTKRLLQRMDIAQLRVICGEVDQLKTQPTQRPVVDDQNHPKLHCLMRLMDTKVDQILALGNYRAEEKFFVIELQHNTRINDQVMRVADWNDCVVQSSHLGSGSIIRSDLHIPQASFLNYMRDLKEFAHEIYLLIMAELSDPESEIYDIERVNDLKNEVAVTVQIEQLAQYMRIALGSSYSDSTSSYSDSTSSYSDSTSSYSDSTSSYSDSTDEELMDAENISLSQLLTDSAAELKITNTEALSGKDVKVITGKLIIKLSNNLAGMLKISRDIGDIAMSATMQVIAKIPRQAVGLEGTLPLCAQKISSQGGGQYNSKEERVKR